MAGIIQAFRKVYHPLGFTKAYNFILWFIFCGGLFGFVLARLEFLNFNGIYCNPFIPNTAGPAQCYGWNKRDLYLVGIKLHLYCVLPAATLACFQFTPIIRHKVLLFHRINGYIILLLALPAIAGAIMIAPVSVGGDLATQGVIGVNAIMFLVSLALAYYNVKRLQIEQHRAWMLRGWFYVSRKSKHVGTSLADTKIRHRPVQSSPRDSLLFPQFQLYRYQRIAYGPTMFPCHVTSLHICSSAILPLWLRLTRNALTLMLGRLYWETCRLPRWTRLQPRSTQLSQTAGG